MEKYMFEIGDVVHVKEEYLFDDQTQENTMRIVIDYQPKNDYLNLITLDRSRTISTRGEFYELVKKGCNETKSLAHDVIRMLPSEEEAEKIIEDLRNYILSVK